MEIKKIRWNNLLQSALCFNFTEVKANIRLLIIDVSFSMQLLFWYFSKFCSIFKNFGICFQGRHPEVDGRQACQVAQGVQDSRSQGMFEHKIIFILKISIKIVDVCSKRNGIFIKNLNYNCQSLLNRKKYLNWKLKFQLSKFVRTENDIHIENLNSGWYCLFLYNP